MPICNSEIDVLFLLDSSGSVGQSNFTIMLNFVSDVIDEFVIGEQAAEFGVITFANEAQVDIRLAELDTHGEFRQALNAIGYRATRTNTAQAIDLAVEELSVRGRLLVPNVLLVLTDGLSNEPPKTLTAAADARSAGSRIITLGIGPKIDRNELNGIASDPDSENVFLIHDFSEESFASILEPLVRETCGEKKIKKCLPTPLAIIFHFCNTYL